MQHNLELDSEKLKGEEPLIGEEILGKQRSAARVHSQLQESSPEGGRISSH